MPTRNKAEKSRVEKKIRTEKTVMILLGVFAVAIFIVLSIIFRDRTPVQADEPVDECLKTVEILQKDFGGTVKAGDGAYILSLKSGIDEVSATIRVYLKSGIPCMEIVRELKAPEPRPTDMFEPTGDELDIDEQEDWSPIAYELAGYLSYVEVSSDSSVLAEKLTEVLISFDYEKNEKATVLFGAYLVSIQLSSQDLLLTVTCEPV